MTPLFIVILTSVLQFGICQFCSFPKAWEGNWFIKEFANSPPIVVNSTSNTIQRFDENLGDCIWMEKDVFLFHNPETKCAKCILIVENHPNVLFSKEDPFCIEEWDKENEESTPCSNFEETGHDIEGNYWFKVDYKPNNCPFGNNDYEFSYTKSGVKCGNPVSHSSSCVNSSKMQWRYEACPDQSASVMKVDRMSCVGNWTESGNQYLVADITQLSNRGRRSLQDRFRCFIFKEKTVPNLIPTKPPNLVGYEIGTFDFPTCTGLREPETAETTLYLEKKVESVNERCDFPQWMASQTWVDMDNSVKFQFDPKLKNTLHIIPQTDPHFTSTSNHQHFLNEKSSLFPLTHSRLRCLNKRNITLNSNNTQPDVFEEFNIAVVGKYTVGCHSKEICLHIVRQSKNVFQLYYMEKDDLNLEALTGICFNASPSALSHGATMIGVEFEINACPLHGQYQITKSKELASSNLAELIFTSESMWSFGCSNPKVVEILLSPNSIEVEHLYCLESWEDRENNFTILSSSNEHPDNFYCLKRTKSTTASSQMTIVAANDCIRNISSFDESDSTSQEPEKEYGIIELIGPGPCEDDNGEENKNGSSDVIQDNQNHPDNSDSSGQFDAITNLAFQLGPKRNNIIGFLIFVYIICMYSSTLVHNIVSHKMRV